jgi:hypothetical protein
MALANILIAKADFTRAEATLVLQHTEKARERQGRSRFDYAHTTVDKVCMDRTPLAAITAGSMINDLEEKDDLGSVVNGPYYLDCLAKPWSKKQMLGLIAGTGSGKSSQTLKIFKEFIRNNPESDDIYFYFNSRNDRR